MWLQNGRAAKGMSVADVAKVTKIQPKILERLEAGKLDGLPAEVFVRGFVRNFARCVGLDESEALRRYLAASPKATVATNAARAMIDAMGDLAPNARAKNPTILRDEPVPPEILPTGSMEMEGIPPIDIDVEVETPAEAPVVAAPVIATPLTEVVTEATAKKKRRRISTAGEASATATTAPKRRRKPIATGTPSEPTPVIAASEIADDVVAPPPKRTRARKTKAPEIAAQVEIATVAVKAPIEASPIARPPTVTVEVVSKAEPVVDNQDVWVSDLWASEMGADLALETREIDHADPATTGGPYNERFEDDGFDATADAGTWTPKMPVVTAMPAMWRRPSYATSPALVAVIDDADPDGAERALEDRRLRESRRTFLPPILLDREGDRSARQGGLTLAVIILLIAATLTLSYLMRRPSASGDGVTRADTARTSRA